MNKKFSTLMAMGLLATSSLCGSAWAQQLNGANVVPVEQPEKGKAWGAGPYIIVSDVDGTAGVSAGDVMLSATVSSDGKILTYSSVPFSIGELTDDLWWSFEETIERNTVTNAPEGYVYKLKSANTGKYLTVNAGGLVLDATKSAHDATKGYYSTFATRQNDKSVQFKNNNNGRLLSYDGTTTTASGLNISAAAVKIQGAGTKLILCTLEKKTLSAAEAVDMLNEVKGGEGFNLDFSVDNKKPWKNDILKELNLKAFNVSAKSLGNGMSIPAGVYFATSYPEELNGKDYIDDVDLFKECTFVAVDPEGNYDINAAHREKGGGFELKTVAGSEMNFFEGSDESDDFSAGDEVFVGNACFTLEIPDPQSDPEAFEIKVPHFHALVALDKNPNKTHSDMKKALYIGVVTDQNENYLVTAEEGLSFETTNTTLMDGDDLAEAFLQKEDAPSVYTIQFVSGEKKAKGTPTEYNQYLTVKKNDYSTTVFDLASTVEYNDADPMYQFVVTAIDKTNKTITFANRQTTHSLTVQLYKNEEVVYTVYNNGGVYVEWINWDDKDEAVSFRYVNLNNTKIVLTPYAVEDKFATFVNRAEGAGLVQFELAKNDASATAFYVGGKRTKEGKLLTGDLLAYTDAEDMTQFELVKGETPETVLNKYIYLKDARIMTSRERDTVAFYQYAVKAFDAEISNYYLDRYYQLSATTERLAQKFVIKENLDGSVALITSAALDNPGASYMLVNPSLKEDEELAWVSKDNYDLASKLNVGLKTFMVNENPAISLEAVPQHVSFGLSRGGFLTMDKNNDAFQNIATEASEDLTFWVDTVHSDNNIPSFYIAKGGNFLYNATDSSVYYTARKNYRFNLENQPNGEAKLIFKAGELVSSDTLRTVVDGKSVLVAEKDNAPKKVKGGLNNFQFQIIKAEDGSDEYVIRQVNNGYNYVQMINSYFYLSANKNTAVRFAIEKQSTPTANEGIETSEVKVIAGEGNLTIAGAQGKKVVVSNILGQVVANTVIASDNAVIAAPAGVVVVAVEGEAAVKAIVK